MSRTNVLPCGEVGEICLDSPQNMLGYWNDSAATLQALRGGWLHTGDMGYMDEDGFVYLVDRKKDMIISGGENIYSREVEEALLAHAAIADVAVIGVPDCVLGRSRQRHRGTEARHAGAGRGAHRSLQGPASRATSVRRAWSSWHSCRACRAAS